MAPSRGLDAAETRALEGLVDVTSLDIVVETLADICGEKADHIRASYSDEPLAQLWSRRAGQLRLVANRIMKETR